MVKIDDSDASYTSHFDVKSTILEYNVRKEKRPQSTVSADPTYDYVWIDDFYLTTK